LDHEEEGQEQILEMDLDSSHEQEEQEEVSWMMKKLKMMKKMKMKQRQSQEGPKFVQTEAKVKREKKSWQMDEGIGDQKKKEKEEGEDCVKVFRYLAQ